MPPRPAVDASVPGRPAGCDWAWRPSPWSRPWDGTARDSGTRLRPGCTLFHDGAGVALRGAGGAVTLEAAEGAAYVSLAIDLPPDAARSLHRAHVLRVTHRGTPGAMAHLRLTLRHGDAEWSRTLPAGAPTEFDLGAPPPAPDAPDAAWIDLFLDPTAAPLRVDDVTMLRYPRAEF